MVDLTKWSMAHKLESCPACGGTMKLRDWSDTYTCGQCSHFRQDRQLQDIMEHDDPTKIKICNCTYCVQERRQIL
jgi:ribosomal protein S27AE